MIRLTKSLYRSNDLLQKFVPQLRYGLPVQRLAFDRQSIMGIMLYSYFVNDRTSFTFKIREINGECSMSGTEFKLSENSNVVLDLLRSQKFVVGQPVSQKFSSCVGHVHKEANDRDDVFQNTLHWTHVETTNYLRQMGIDIGNREHREKHLVRHEPRSRFVTYNVPYHGATVDVKIGQDTMIDMNAINEMYKTIKPFETNVFDWWIHAFYPFIVRPYLTTPKADRD
jgi:hypothetical protein